MNEREKTVERRVVFSKPGRVDFEVFEPEAVGEGMVAVRSLYSLMSTGTENIVLHRRYEPGSHWDRWVKFPFWPGYAVVGEIVQAGPEAGWLVVGDRVVLRAPHASHHVAEALRCTPVPPGMDLSVTPWFALAKIAFMGARAAEQSLGDTLVVIGLGPIGQMSVRWATAAGARAVVAIDTVAPRLRLAQRGGATAAIAKPVGEAADDLRDALEDRQADVVIDSTGNAEVLEAALGLVRAHGRVVILGDTGHPTSQHLTGDLITRGITIVGAHDSHSMQTPIWDGDRSIHSLFFHLVTTGRFDVEGLNTHTFHPNDCAAAYELADQRRGDTLGIIFDWTRV